MKMNSRMTTWLVALAIAFCAALYAKADSCCAEVNSWTDLEGTEWYFTLNAGGEAILGKTSNCNWYWYGDRSAVDNLVVDESGHLDIPASVEDDDGNSHPVVGIGDYAFEDCCDLVSVTIPEGVRSVGRYAFRGCENLTGVTIASSVTSIDEMAFIRCRGLADADGFVIIRGVLYEYFGKADPVVIPSGVTTIGCYAFEGCEMTSVVIPNTVTRICRGAFAESDLVSIVIPDSVTHLGIGIFGECVKLVSAVIPDSVTVLDDDNDDEDYGLFDGCKNLTNVTLGKNIPRITTCMFYNCRSLTSVTIPASVTAIGYRAFRKCTNLSVIAFQGNAPMIERFDYYDDDDDDDYDFLGVIGLPCVGYVSRVSTGWNVPIPGVWNGLRLEYGNVNSRLYPIQPGVVAAPVSTAVASVYDGYLQGENGAIVGSVQLKVSKANARTGLCKVTGTIQEGANKTKVSGTVDATGVFVANGLTVTLDASGMAGNFGGYNVDGSRNIFSASDSTSKAAAAAAMKVYKGSYTVAWQEGGIWGGLTVSIGNKGKARVAGFLPNGTKVSANGQLLIGNGSRCVTVVSTNKKTPLAFNLWFKDTSLEVEGLNAGIAAKVGVLTDGKAFTCSLLDTAVPVTVNGKKWVVTTDKATALSLTFTPKTGAFKGSFKVGKQKATVNGVVVDGKGYGSVVIKNVSSVPVTIE